MRAANLAPGSDPSVLPGPLLIADRDNRLIDVSPTGQLLWEFPRRGDLSPRQTFNMPDDAFFAPTGRQVIATQEDDFVISVIEVTSHRIVYRYGHPGVPGSSANYLYNPDDALLTNSGPDRPSRHQELPATGDQAASPPDRPAIR